MRSVLLCLFLVLGSVPCSRADTLADKCSALGGKIVDRFECPQSKLVREERFCVVQDPKGVVFFNGCTDAIGEYGDVFFEACFKHDLCYHHEPSFSKKTKEDCDKQFKENMYSVCAKAHKGFSCKNMARMFYGAVKLKGEKSWNCSDERLDYRVYR
ncbi:MAG: hypothetical protein KDD62_07380 [Bdellovibrionales bacterium]|nr:hypothetical protein [Bdellovibrionales bacterium]